MTLDNLFNFWILLIPLLKLGLLYLPSKVMGRIQMSGSKTLFHIHSPFLRKWLLAWFGMYHSISCYIAFFLFCFLKNMLYTHKQQIALFCNLAWRESYVCILLHLFLSTLFKPVSFMALPTCPAKNPYPAEFRLTLYLLWKFSSVFLFFSTRIWSSPLLNSLVILLVLVCW